MFKMMIEKEFTHQRIAKAKVDTIASVLNLLGVFEPMKYDAREHWQARKAVRDILHESSNEDFMLRVSESIHKYSS